MRTVLSNEILLWIKLTLCIANSLQNLDIHEEILNSFIKLTQSDNIGTEIGTYKQFSLFYYRFRNNHNLYLYRV